jgi:hypothetical protein
MGRVYAIFLFLVCFALEPLAISGQTGQVKFATGMDTEYTRLVSSGEQYLFEASVEMIRLQPDLSGPGYTSVELPGYYASGDPGSPALPRRSKLFEAGPHEVTRIRFEEIDSVIIDLDQLGVKERIVPFRPSVRKGMAPGAVLADSLIYSQDRWIGGPVVEVEYEGRMRELSLSNLHFNPVQYNPRRGLLKLFFHVRCIIETAGPGAEWTVPEHAFSGVFSRVVRREQPAGKKALRAEQPMTLVILSDTMFRETLQPLIRWKTIKGFKVIEAYRQDSLVGSTGESIRGYLKDLYEDPPEGIAPPSFLLIVGDVEQIPRSRNTGQVTDLYYAEYDGEGDYIPDLFYGRISVAGPGQLQAVVGKILEYERYQFPDPSFLDEAVLIAGVDAGHAGTYGNGQVNYAFEYYLNTDNGHVAHLFDYPGSGSRGQEIREMISGGVGFVNYTGHGLADRWEDPAFRTGDIDDLQNQGKYPVMIGNGCETNLFTLDECFAEALIRAPGKGALAYIGCTSDSYWDEDYYWAVGVGPVSAHPEYVETSPGFYDKVFHTHGEAYDLWTPTLGEMVFGGNMAVQQSSSTRKKFYWEIYQLAGDPTIVPWFTRPPVQDVSHPGSLPGGTGRLDLTCAPNSYVALSKDGILLDALHATREGFVTLRIPDTLTAGNLDLVISADRFRPWCGEVEVGIPAPLYLDLLGYGLTGESVEPDHKISPGESASLNLELVNRGDEVMVNDTVILFSGSGSIEILDSVLQIPRLDPGDTLDLRDVFRFRAGITLEDQSPAVLGIRFIGSGTPLFIKEKLHAPVLLSGHISWDDRPLGNGNGISEPGEWLLCSWILYNTGHFRTGPVQGALFQELPSHSAEMIFMNSPVIEAGDSAVLHFRIRLVDVGKGWHSPGPVIAGDQCGSVVDSFRVALNRYAEDFNPGWARRFPFVNSSPLPWRPDGDNFTLYGYSLRSGKISHSGHTEITLAIETETDDSISFAFRVSSEYGYDFLSLYVDSVLVERWSGITGWDYCSHQLETGRHEITWSYRKDATLSKGEDAAWIDDLSLPASAFRKGDLSLMEIVSPVSGPWLSGREQPGIRVRNTSMDTIPGFSAGISLDGIAVDVASRIHPLLPGSEATFLLEPFLDLSGFGEYVVGVSLLSDISGYPGNNWLEKPVSHYLYPDLSLSLDRIDMVEGICAEALVLVENAGNIPLDSFQYEVRIDGALSETGLRYIALDPGGVVTEPFRLAGSLQELPSGTHDYTVRALVEDSVMYNNEVTGTLVWYAAGMISRGMPAGWQIYPNPASSGFHLRLGEPAGEEILFQLYSMTGICVGSYPVAPGSDRLRISTAKIPPGRYLLRLVNTGEAVQVIITR